MDKFAAEIRRQVRLVEEVDEFCPHCGVQFREKYGPRPKLEGDEDARHAQFMSGEYDDHCPACDGIIDRGELTDEQIDAQANGWGGEQMKKLLTDQRAVVRRRKAERMSKEAAAAPAGYLEYLNSPKYFGREGSQVKAEDILQSAQTHEIDPRLLAAIVANESAWGTARNAREANNFSGMMGAGKQLFHYDSPQAGIDAAARLLKERYVGKGLTTPETIGPVYAPVGAKNDPTGVNSNWIRNVNGIMGRIPQPATPAAPQPAPAAVAQASPAPRPAAATQVPQAQPSAAPAQWPARVAVPMVDRSHMGPSKKVLVGPPSIMSVHRPAAPAAPEPALAKSGADAWIKAAAYTSEEKWKRLCDRRGQCPECRQPNQPENFKCTCQPKEAALTDDKALELHKAREATNTSPTEKQKERGNYKKGRITLRGRQIAIENPIGSERSGVDPDGKAWRSIMHRDYGYFVGSMANDGDPVDVFIGEDPENDPIWIIDQVTEKGDFDEPKVVLGAKTEKDAKELYLRHYPLGWKGIGAITKVTDDELQKWLDSSPSGKYASKQMKAHVKVATALYKISSTAAADAAYATAMKSRDNVRNMVDDRSWWERQGGLKGLGGKALEFNANLMTLGGYGTAKGAYNRFQNIRSGKPDYDPYHKGWLSASDASWHGLAAKGVVGGLGWGLSKAYGAAKDTPWALKGLWSGKFEGERPSLQYQGLAMPEYDSNYIRNNGRDNWREADQALFGGGAAWAADKWSPFVNMATGNKFAPELRGRTAEDIMAGASQPHPMQPLPSDNSNDLWVNTLNKKSSEFQGYSRTWQAPIPTKSEIIGNNFKDFGAFGTYGLPKLLLGGLRAVATKDREAVAPVVANDFSSHIFRNNTPEWLQPVGGFLDGTVGNFANWARWLLTGKR